MPSVKNIGKPYAGKPHVRFDEGGLARACLLLYPSISGVIHPAQRMQQQRQHLERLQQRLQLAQAHGSQHQQWRWQALRQRLRAVRPDVADLQTRHAGYARRLHEVMARNGIWSATSQK